MKNLQMNDNFIGLACALIIIFLIIQVLDIVEITMKY